MSPWESERSKARRRLERWLSEHLPRLDISERCQLYDLIDDLEDATYRAGCEAGRPD